MVIQGSRVIFRLEIFEVSDQFSCFFKDPSRFFLGSRWVFYGYSRFQGGFSSSQVSFHGFTVFMVFEVPGWVFHGSKGFFMVTQCCSAVFIVFHGSRSVFMVFKVFRSVFPKYL